MITKLICTVDTGRNTGRRKAMIYGHGQSITPELPLVLWAQNVVSLVCRFLTFMTDEQMLH